jgi:hypothetical protein
MVKNKIIKKTDSQTDFWEDAKSYIDIRNCSFGFKCNQKWDSLLKRKEKNIKFCHECEKEVYLIDTNEELMHAIKFNHCVAIKVRHDEIPQIKKSHIDVGMLTSPNYDDPAYLRIKK